MQVCLYAYTESMFAYTLDASALKCASIYLVMEYSAKPLWSFLAEKVPIHPLSLWSRPIFHVTNNGLQNEYVPECVCISSRVRVYVCALLARVYTLVLNKLGLCVACLLARMSDKLTIRRS